MPRGIHKEETTNIVPEGERVQLPTQHHNNAPVAFPLSQRAGSLGMESLHGTQGTGEHQVGCSFVFKMSIRSAWGGSMEWSGCLTQSTQPDNNHKMNPSWLLEEFKTEIITKILKCSAWQTYFLHYFCKITSEFESLTTIWFGQPFLPILILPEVFFFPMPNKCLIQIKLCNALLGILRVTRGTHSACIYGLAQVPWLRPRKIKYAWSGQVQNSCR